jgi:hypothetical protein
MPNDKRLGLTPRPRHCWQRSSVKIKAVRGSVGRIRATLTQLRSPSPHNGPNGSVSGAPRELSVVGTGEPASGMPASTTNDGVSRRGCLATAEAEANYSGEPVNLNAIAP